LLGSPHLTNLRRLVVCNNEVGPGVDLVAGPRFSRLSWLDLGGSNSAWGRPGDDDFTNIVTSPHLARLEYLGFDCNAVTDEGVCALAVSPTMSRLRSLCLAGNRVTWSGLEELSQSSYLTSLEHLDLSYGMEVGFDDHAVDVLIASPLLDRLTLLDLSHNPISGEALSRLAECPDVSRLRALAVGAAGAHLRVREGVRALAASPHLWELRRLVVAAVPLDDATAEALARSRHLGNLQELVVRGDGPDLTDAGLRALRERFGDGLMIDESR
jgi:hypothetical protein